MRFNNGKILKGECPICSSLSPVAVSESGRNSIKVLPSRDVRDYGNAPPGSSGWSYDVAYDENGELWYHIPFGRSCTILHHRYIKDDMRVPYSLKLSEDDETIEC